MLSYLPRARFLNISLVTLGLLVAPASVGAQTPSPVYTALGDSIEFGLGDDVPGDGIGYVVPFGAFLTSVIGQRVDVENFGVPFAETRDILRIQVPQAVAAMHGHSQVVVTWGGGGNDLGHIATGPEAAACKQSQSCLARFNALLNEIEQTIDRTIATLRQAVGPTGRILMRTQYNALARTGCAAPDVVALGNATLEGAPGTVLDSGLNDRIRSIAAKYHAQVIDLFVPLTVNANVLVSSDCIHPSGAGYQAILALAEAAFLAGP